MNGSIKTLLIILAVISLGGCSAGLVKDVYKYSKSSNDLDSMNSIIVLSNLELTNEEIDTIRQDYLDEKDGFRKYLLSYLLAKRTQEYGYIEYFIADSNHYLGFLKENRTGWVSIENPVYETLATYSTTNDDAFRVLLKLGQIADGANATMVSSDIKMNYELNQDRVLNIANDLGIKKEELLILMVEE
jgi:hypothetical protein